MSNSFIWLIERTLSGATTPGQSRPSSDSNERVLWIPLSFGITVALLSDGLISYTSTRWCILPLGRYAVGVFYTPSRLGCCQLVDFVVLARHEIEIKDNEKIEKSPDFATEFKKKFYHIYVLVIRIVHGALGHGDTSSNHRRDCLHFT